MPIFNNGLTVIVNKEKYIKLIKDTIHFKKNGEKIHCEFVIKVIKQGQEIQYELVKLYSLTIKSDDDEV